MALNRDFLRDLGLEDEQVKKVMAQLGKDTEALKSVDDLKGQVSSLTTERDGLKDQLSESTKQLNQLKNDNKDNEALQDTIKSLQDKNKQQKEELENKLVQTQKNNAIELALRDAGARNSKAVTALLDQDTIKFEDGKLTGLKEQLSGIKKDNDFLFQTDENETENKPSFSTGKNPTPPQTNSKNKDFSQMSYEEVQAAIQDDN